MTSTPLSIDRRNLLGLTALTLNMDMHSRLFPREKVETEAAFAKNRRTHGRNDTRNACSRKRRLDRMAFRG